MDLKVSLLLATIQCAMSLSVVVPFCFETDCYFQLENSGKSWMEAQEMCRRYNSTLPIVDTPNRQRSVVAALQNFTLTSYIFDVWLGASASDYGANNWRWLEGSQYNGTVSGVYMYNTSYALILKFASILFLTRITASAPWKSYPFICQYNTAVADVCKNGTGRVAFVVKSRCYVTYDFALSWFNARNACIANGGDLASFNDTRLLDLVSFNTNGSWIGLRSSQWFWRNAVTGLSSDVTFTSWSSNQPDDASPSCIAIDSGNFPNWRDSNCSNSARYICQVTNTTWLVSTTSASIDPNASGATSSSDDRASNRPTNYQPVSANGCQQNDRAVAVGVGIGVPCAIVILVLVVALIVQHRKLKRYSANFKSEGSQIKDSKEISTSSPTSVLPAVQNEENHQYQQLQNRSELQEQRQCEQLPQSQYEH